MPFAKPEDVLEYLNDLREAHSPLRAEIVIREQLGISYANGKQWANVPSAPASSSVETVEVWDEDWDPQSHEVRVVDNRIGPLVRRIAAGTNATKIEAVVKPPKHRQNIQTALQARVAEQVLIGLESDAGFTRTARQASSLRWKIGSVVMFATLSQKQNEVPADVALNPDGSPVEVSDSWVRWNFAPLSDCIWDATNIRRTLRDHHVFAIEEVLVAKVFEQRFGPLEQYGLSKDNLPTIAQLAPHKIAASSIGGSTIFASFSRNSNERGVRLVTLFETHDEDPARWPTMYQVLDTTPNPGAVRTSGNVINMDSPETPYGASGLPIVKLDAFVRDDAVWSFGLPHVLMAPQDIINIVTSLQLTQLVSVIYGQWLVDTSVVGRDEFTNNLAQRQGGVLNWNSRAGQINNPPTFVTPPAPNTEFITLLAEKQQTMRDSAHIAPIQLGISKSHVPRANQQAVLQEATTVLDNIVIEDVDAYSDLLRVTLGTVRKLSDGPNRMLAQLRDRYGFDHRDLITLQEIDPENIQLSVSVRQGDVTSRSPQEREQQISGGLQLGIVTPAEAVVAMADEIERPLTRSQGKQVDFIKGLLVRIMDGMEYEGIPSISFPIFEVLANEATYELDMFDDEDKQRMGFIQEALMKQQQIAQERQPQEGEGQPGAQQPAGLDVVGGEVGLFPPDQLGSRNGSGAPESVNPITNPVGAAGGLPLGLGA